VIANVGVLAAAGGVALFAAPWPDLLVGGAIAAIFLRSAVRVLREAWPEFRKPAPAPPAAFTISPRPVRADRR
jgi:Co/Zn/Cd efflux system component